MKDITEKREREKRIVREMISLYCRRKHGSQKNDLCKECRELLDYAVDRSDKCPFMAEKTFCSNCRVHCYKPEMREKIRSVMRYAGRRIIFTHPIMAVSHLVESNREKRSRVTEKKGAV